MFDYISDVEDLVPIECWNVGLEFPEPMTVGRKAMYSGKSTPMFQMNLLPPFSRLKCKLIKKAIRIKR
jgi:hypothetical protein